ncbi:hypothetical protein R3W88_030402 [Solanum pinnatisectum]|uniref:Uncharacterized protein n=1 Tax=Solanum pinnatisectum TaxID=50273 RepID=A0AAV9K872_9SOLN|nr:hypothetical protein R3W88_030402 [Solanum pinnatisectum]
MMLEYIGFLLRGGRANHHPPASNVSFDYELPDGQVTNFGAERLRCPEVLFQPTILPVR